MDVEICDIRYGIDNVLQHREAFIKVIINETHSSRWSGVVILGLHCATNPPQPLAVSRGCRSFQHDNARTTYHLLLHVLMGCTTMVLYLVGDMHLESSHV